jgi:hypothetical protein
MKVRLRERSTAPVSLAFPIRTAAFTEARCWEARPGLGRDARMLSMRNGFPVSRDRLRAVLRICPPPSPREPSMWIMGDLPVPDAFTVAVHGPNAVQRDDALFTGFVFQGDEEPVAGFETDLFQADPLDASGNPVQYAQFEQSGPEDRIPPDAVEKLFDGNHDFSFFLIVRTGGADG